MPTYVYVYDDERVEHPAKHGVTIEEFAQVVSRPRHVVRSRSSENIVAFGLTAAGRSLACVYQPVDELHVIVITAYEL
jgi:uncharacterized DUF497 family protein